MYPWLLRILGRSECIIHWYDTHSASRGKVPMALNFFLAIVLKHENVTHLHTGVVICMYKQKHETTRTLVGEINEWHTIISHDVQIATPREA